MYAQIALAAYQIISGVHQAETIRAQAELSKQIDEMNAQYAELDAWNAEKSGIAQEARYQSTIDQTIGAQKVVNAANDVDSNFGTAADLQAESKLNGFLNQLDIRNQAHEAALGYKNQARDFRLKGSQGVAQAELNAESVKTQGIMNAAQTGVSGYERYKDRTQGLKTAANASPATAEIKPPPISGRGKTY